jgi:predicted phosphodiesterase
VRLHVISDLHQEFGEVEVSDVDCDCVIVAGDASTKHQGLEWILRHFRKVPVIYICGNHEYYGEKLPSLTEKLKERAAGTNVHFLENDSVTIDGIHFFGCTLWSDLALHGDWRIGALVVEAMMNDYKRIRNSDHGYRHLRGIDTRALHMESLAAMRTFFSTHDPRNSVVVTHHAPSAKSLPDYRLRDALSCGYASHLDSFIEEHQPQLWIHGHIHHSQYYRIGKTRILTNPRGYPDEPNPGFIPNLAITVEPK